MEKSLGAPVTQDPLFLGHPKGLAYIAFTEAWERFSFYGMQALLMLYMTGYLLQPGTVDTVAGFSGLRAAIEGVFGALAVPALASQIFGLYVALIYFVPVLGGLLGDRLLGRRRAVLLGAVAMAAGHFMMAFETLFLTALLSLIVGSGLLKGNLAAQVGNLYARDDRRREPAYAVYVTAINIGAFVAPLVCGTLGELYGWHYGFGVAGFGMLIGIAIYLSGSRYLPVETLARDRVKVTLQPGDARIVVALLTMLAITSLFWIVQAQVWNIYPLWLRDRVDRTLGLDLAVPVTWFQSLDALAVLLLAPVAIAFWRWQARRGVEPDDLNKIGLGCAAAGATCLLLAAGEWLAQGAPVLLLWPVLFHFGVAIAYLYVAPIALALVSRAAPVAVNATMVGTYYLGIFIGGIVSGWLGRFYEPLHAAPFWLAHAFIGIAGTVAILVLRPWFRRVFRL
ncbi:MAG: peptide MFS transporter [Steroidobacter sp.]|nr:peptide MFS transporter [Steroidobacter sp.]